MDHIPSGPFARRPTMNPLSVCVFYTSKVYFFLPNFRGPSVLLTVYRSCQVENRRVVVIYGKKEESEWVVLLVVLLDCTTLMRSVTFEWEKGFPPVGYKYSHLCGPIGPSR